MSDYTGTWTSDPVHSSLDFTARHNIVSRFRGQAADFTVTVTGEGDTLTLNGVAEVATITTKDDNLTGHLRSPEFFDLERHPQVRIASAPFTPTGDAVTIEAELEMRGVTRPVTLTGTVAGPLDAAFGGVVMGLDLTATVDRTAFGMNWNAPMPGGGFMLSNDVQLVAHLELIKR